MTPPVLVIGAGPTGLSAAYHLGNDALLIEQEDRVGGWCRSIVEGGFTFDYAGHIMFSNDPYVHELYELLLGENVHWQDREAWIYSHGVHTRYPFQGSLYGLPPDVIQECLVGAIEARFGPLRPKKDGGANGAARAAASHDTEVRPGATSFRDFIEKVWGAGIAKHFALPYNRKLWTFPLEEIETSWLEGRVPLPDLPTMIEGALRPSPRPMGPNARFGYPLRGGFQALMNGFLPHLRGSLRLRTRVVAISPHRRRVRLSNGVELPYERLISTMPLPALIESLGSEAPARIRRHAKRLQHVSVRCVNLGVGREHLTEKHWIYYPEDPVFHRIFVQGNASPFCNPPGGFGLTCEISYSPQKPLPCEGDDLIRRCIRDCESVGMMKPGDPVRVANQVDLPTAYVVYDHHRNENVAAIRDWLVEHDILLAGRYSEWEYFNSDHAFLSGKRAAELAAKPREEEWDAVSAGEADERPSL